MTAVWGLLVNIGGFRRVKVRDECWRFRAEHSQFEMVAEFIDCGGNALPLRELWE